MKTHTMLRKLPSWTFALFAASSLGACDAAGPLEVDGLVIADLAGVWELTAIAVTSDADPSVRFDLIGAGGATTFSIQSSGNFTGSVLIPAALTGGVDMTVPLSGVMRLMAEGTQLWINFVPEVPPFFTTMQASFELDGGALTILNEGSAFDFDGDGVPEPATLFAEAIRH
jgi:hypothetical protein